MPSIDDIAAEYVERAAALDPCYATNAGIAGHDHELPDLSADGFAERAGLDRSTLAALDAAEAPDRREQVARAAMRERMALAAERYDAGDTTSELDTIASWVQGVRKVFDLMPTDGEEAAANIAQRMAAVPRAYRQLSATLLAAARDGRCAARRQVEEVAGQCAAWAKPGDAFYSGLAAGGAGHSRARGHGRHGRARRLPRPRADAAGQEEGCLRAGGLRAGLAVFPRRRRGSAGGLRLELGRARPATGRDGAGQ